MEKVFMEIQTDPLADGVANKKGHRMARSLCHPKRSPPREGSWIGARGLP